MTLRGKLVLGLGAVLLLVGVQVAATLLLLSQVVEQSALLVQPALTRVDLLAHAEADVLRHRTLEYSYLWTDDAAIRQETLAEMVQLQSAIGRRLTQYDELPLDDVRQATLDGVRARLAAYLASDRAVVAAVQLGDRRAALWEYQLYQPDYQELDDQVHRLRHLEYAATEALRDQMVRTVDWARLPLAAVVLLIAALEVALVWYLARGLARSLALLRAGATRIADERFDEPIPAPPERDLGDLADALNGTMGALAAGRAERTRLEDERLSIARDRLAQVVRAQEDERARISRELHDQAAQALTALRYELGHLKRRAGEPVPEEEIERLVDLTADAARRISSLARDLRPSVLDDLGLLPALRGHARELSERTGIAVEVVARHAVPRLGSDAETTVFRVVQEALTNVAKHAKAEHARVELWLEGHALRVAVEDDGRGFDASRVNGQRAEGRRGLGLTGIRERLQLLDGTLEIVAAPGAGTRLVVTLPLAAARLGAAA